MESKEKKPTPLYKQIKLLGQGSFGKAYLVKNTLNNKNYVIKSMILEEMSEKEQKEAYLEAKILEKLDHPNIIKFIEVFRSTKPSAMLNIVMDFADGGDLQKKIKEYQKEGRFFNENTIIDWFTQLCLAIKHIHDKKVLHRDLKSQNVFLTQNGIIKLGDFGIAKCLNFTMEKAQTIVGTPYYLSPEIVQNIPYSFKSDIWSLGVLLYEMICLRMPFEANSLPLLSLKISRGVYSPIPNKFSMEMRNLVKALLSLDPSKRPSINEILSYGIIQSRVRDLLKELDYKDSLINKNGVDVSKSSKETKLSNNTDTNSSQKDELNKQTKPEENKEKDVSSPISNTKNITSPHEKEKENSKFLNKKEFFEKKKEQREGVIYCGNKNIQNMKNEVNDEETYKSYLKKITLKEKSNQEKEEENEDEEMRRSKRMLIELSNIHIQIKEETNNSPSKDIHIKQRHSKEDEIQMQILNQNQSQANELELKEKKSENLKFDSNEKEEKGNEQTEVTECVTELSEEIADEIKSELIENIGESNFHISFEIVDKNTPKELFYYDKKAIIDEITNNEELSKLNNKQKELIVSKIPEIFALVFDKKQKDFRFSFKSMVKKKD